MTWGWWWRFLEKDTWYFPKQKPQDLRPGSRPPNVKCEVTLGSICAKEGRGKKKKKRRKELYPRGMPTRLGEGDMRQFEKLLFIQPRPVL